MTSTPAHLQRDTPKDTPGFEMVDTAKRPKLAADTFVPARKISAIPKPVPSQETQSTSPATDTSNDSELGVSMYISYSDLYYELSVQLP
jgi:hypothetical protein